MPTLDLLPPAPVLTALPAPPHAEQFRRLQALLTTQFRDVFPHPNAPRTILVIPSLSLNPAELAKISGVHHYEERLLCLLLLLRYPRARVIYVTSQPIAPTIVDYYLHLLTGIPTSHARRRLTLLACHDASPRPLTEKVLARPRLLKRLRRELGPGPAHLTCFNATALERDLALQLGLPLYATDPALNDLGSKSGSRKIFREAGIPCPDGFEDLRDTDDLIGALAALKRRSPDLKRAVIKLEEGFSGEGNAIFHFHDSPSDQQTEQWVRQHLGAQCLFGAHGETWRHYAEKFNHMGGVAEAFIEGHTKRSPSGQARINPLGHIRAISTHDQVLGGSHGQVYLGCAFPADEAYRHEVQAQTLRVAEVLRGRGVLGRFGVDFVSVREGDVWCHHAIEINLRKGGTTHPFLMLDYLVDGTYDAGSGLYFTPAGQPRYYHATDNLHHSAYLGLTPDDLIDIAVENNLHFHGTTLQGVVFHLIGALSEFGKLGMLAIGATPQRAQELYDETVAVLDRETAPPS